MKQILEDKRKIARVVFDEYSFYEVGSGGVEKIEAYGEPGEYCLVPWIAIIVNGVVSCRFHASQGTIVYEDAA